MKKFGFRIKQLLIAFVICYVGYILINQQIMINRIKKEISIVNEQNKKVEESNKYLQDQIEYSKTDDYKEKVAREKIGLIKPGEIVYVLQEQN